MQFYPVCGLWQDEVRQKKNTALRNRDVASYGAVSMQAFSSVCKQMSTPVHTMIWLCVFVCHLILNSKQNLVKILLTTTCSDLSDFAPDLCKIWALSEWLTQVQAWWWGVVHPWFHWCLYCMSPKSDLWRCIAHLCKHGWVVLRKLNLYSGFMTQIPADSQTDQGQGRATLSFRGWF